MQYIWSYREPVPGSGWGCFFDTLQYILQLSHCTNFGITHGLGNLFVPHRCQIALYSTMCQLLLVRKTNEQQQDLLRC